jgi:hypothetical protein
MIKINAIHCRHGALIAALTIGLSGAITGCLQTDNSAFAKYDAASYKANTDGTGYAGTWILTFNNEQPQDPANPVAVYSRNLIRIRPIDGAPDRYEVNSCNSATGWYSTVEVSNNTILLPAQGGDRMVQFSPTTEGHMISNAYEQTRHAVRLSSDPDLDAGSVGMNVFSDGAGLVRRPLLCFDEWQSVGPKHQGSDVLAHEVRAYGFTNQNEHGYAVVSETPVGLVTNLDGYDDGRSLNGPILGNLSTLKSTIQGISGTVRTLGREEDVPPIAGSLVFDIRL